MGFSIPFNYGNTRINQILKLNEMKKHELLKYAYDNYPKGVWFKSLSGNFFKSTGKFAFDNGSILMVREDGKLMGNVFTKDFAEIVEPNKEPLKIAVRVDTEEEAKAIVDYLGQEFTITAFIGKVPCVIYPNKNERWGYNRLIDHEDQCLNDHEVLSFSDFAKEHGIEFKPKEIEVKLFNDNVAIITEKLIEIRYNGGNLYAQLFPSDIEDIYHAIKTINQQ